MKKYWTFFTVEWQQALNYRPESLVWFLLELIPLVLMINLSGYLQSTHRLNHVQYSQFILYYIINLIISRISSIHFENGLIDDIKDGKISHGLLKPFSFYWHLLPREASWRLSGLMYIIPPVIILIPLIRTLTLPKFTLSNILIFTFSIMIAYFQRYFVGWLISIPSFWFGQSKVLIHLKWMAEGVFGGAWLPLYLFPLWWQHIASFTPFYYWIYFPTQVLLGNAKNIPLQIFISIAWMFILYFLSSRFWRLAVKKYSSVGN